MNRHTAVHSVKRNDNNHRKRSLLRFIWFVMEWIRCQNPMLYYNSEDENEEQHDESSVVKVHITKGSPKLKYFYILLEGIMSFWDARHVFPNNCNFSIFPLSEKKTVRFFLLLSTVVEPTMEMMARTGSKENYWSILLHMEWLQFFLRSSLLYHRIDTWRKTRTTTLLVPLVYHQSDPTEEIQTYDISQSYTTLQPQLSNTNSIKQDSIYIGHRTGKRIQVLSEPLPTKAIEFKSATYFSIGELLYISRPLVWAFCQKQICNSFKTNKRHQQFSIWCLNLFMDLTSLTCLRQSMKLQLKQLLVLCTTQNQHATYSRNLSTAFQLLYRRKLRLWLYCIRSPFWDLITQPIVTLIFKCIRTCIPFFGPLLERTAMSWILYYRSNHHLLEQLP